MPSAGGLWSEAWLPVMCRPSTLGVRQQLLESRLHIYYTSDTKRQKDSDMRSKWDKIIIYIPDTTSSGATLCVPGEWTVCAPPGLQDHHQTGDDRASCCCTGSAGTTGVTVCLLCWTQLHLLSLKYNVVKHFLQVVHFKCAHSWRNKQTRGKCLATVNGFCLNVSGFQ